MRLENKIAIITGSGGDIGGISARLFLEQGASIVLVGFHKETLQETSDQLKEFSTRLRIFVGDVAEYDDMKAAAAYTAREFGRIDILMTCAGIARHMPIDQMPVDIWEIVMKTNIDGVFNACKAVVPYMKNQKYGRIANIASIGGRTGRPRVGVNYAASKAAVVGLTQCLSYELGPDNITVNAIAPGPISGRMTNNLPPEMVDGLKNGVRIGRLGLPAEVAYAAIYLCSDEAAWTTGEVIDINGGLYY
ncbi:MAG: SDR family NAD(P)-dependent oxidoreductase [Clostridia bacterium]